MDTRGQCGHRFAIWFANCDLRFAFCELCRRGFISDFLNKLISVSYSPHSLPPCLPLPISPLSPSSPSPLSPSPFLPLLHLLSPLSPLSLTISPLSLPLPLYSSLPLSFHPLSLPPSLLFFLPTRLCLGPRLRAMNECRWKYRYKSARG